MGGNALKHLGTERIPAERFPVLFNELNEMYGSDWAKFACPPSYRNKPSHGDMDILVTSNESFNSSCEEEKFLSDYVKNKIKPAAFYHNEGSCEFSFLYKNHQIDLAYVDKEIYETSFHYFSWNDMHNLIGKIARRMGLKWGFDGLYAIFDSKRYGLTIKSHLHYQILISRDIEKIINFLGFDYKRYSEGFDTLEDIFEFVINGKYFNSEIFKYENLNAANRVRDKKRPTYNSFLIYLNENKIKNNYAFPSNEESHKAVDAYFPEVNLSDQIEEFIENSNLNQIIKSKFNGTIVSGITGLEDKSLASFMNNFKKSHSDFKNYIIDNESKKVENDIMKFLKENK